MILQREVSLPVGCTTSKKYVCSVGFRGGNGDCDALKLRDEDKPESDCVSISQCKVNWENQHGLSVTLKDTK